MGKLSGDYQCQVDTPMGKQDFLLTVQAAGDAFHGKAAGAIGGSAGALQIEGTIEDGDTLVWSMAVPKPLPITLGCRAKVEGDVLAGKVKAGIFGSYAISGVRTGVETAE